MSSPHHYFGSDFGQVGPLGGQLVGLEPLADPECCAAECPVGGARVGGEHLVPKPQAFGQASGGGGIESGEYLFLAALVHQVDHVPAGDGRPVADVEEEFLDFGGEHAAVGADQVDKAGGSFGLDAFAQLGGLVEDELC